MNQYKVELIGLTPLLMHRDNLIFEEKKIAWRKAPANKELSTKGDDRSPAWTWLGYLYHDTQVVGISSDNVMTMLREGGARVANKGKETYKKQTQAGILIDTQQWDICVPGHTSIDVKQFNQLLTEDDFTKHIAAAETLGFELLVKRAKIGSAKHIRVRPLFRNWTAHGTLTVIDEKISGLQKEILQKIFDVAGALVGLGDWRPSSPKSSGTFGKFSAKLMRL